MRKLSAHFINVTIIGTILFLVPALLLGQTQVMNANIFDYRDGMSQSTVKYITEDRFGNIWLSTDDGINIFNGKTFETVSYTHLDVYKRQGKTNGIISLVALFFRLKSCIKTSVFLGLLLNKTAFSVSLER